MRTSNLKHERPRLLTCSLCILGLLGIWLYVTIRWDYTVYSQSQLVPVTCTFDSFWIGSSYRGGGPLYIVDTNNHYYHIISSNRKELCSNLHAGDTLEMLVTPRGSIGNPDIACLMVNGHVYCTYANYYSRSSSARTQYFALSFFEFSISAVLIIRIIVLTRRIRTKRKKREKRTQEKMKRFREAGELHPKKQKSKRKNTPPT